MKLIQLHILLSTLAFSVLCVAALQAMVLAVQEHLLRYKQFNKFLTMLPAMQAMEVFLFRIITVGFVLLTLVLISSLFSFQHVFASSLWQKTLLSLFAWLVFMALLLGRYYFGWRGKVAIRWTLSGVFLVVLIYLGTIFFTS